MVYVINWTWVLNETAAPSPYSPNPLILDPAGWSGDNPVHYPHCLEYTISDGNRCHWTTVTFTQIAGPTPEFGSVTVSKFEHGHLSRRPSARVEVPAQLLSGVYTIMAIVQPGNMIGTGALVRLAFGFRSSFSETLRPVSPGITRRRSRSSVPLKTGT